MARRKSTPPLEPPPRRAAPRRSRTLLVIDNEPVRRAALAIYLKLENETAAVLRQIEAFQSGDLPAFQRWEAAVLGATLTELREIARKVEEKQLILEAIDDEVLWSGCTRLTAYRRVMKELTEPEEPSHSEKTEARFHSREEDEFNTEDPAHDGSPRLFGDRDLPRGFDVAEYDQLPRARQREFREFYESMAMVFEAMTGAPAPELDALLERERQSASRAHGRKKDARATPLKRAAEPSPEARRGADRLKELYRRLVRQLHPDANGEFSTRNRDLWHEVQIAHADRDLARLEALAGRVEIGLRGASAQMPLSVLARISSDMRAALRGLRSQLAEARKQPAWRFSQKTPAQLTTFERHRRNALAGSLHQAQALLARATAILDDFAARSRIPKKRPGSRRAPASASDQMSFF